MTRYEYFEKWMTTNEWREFKEQFPHLYRRNIDRCSVLRAIAKRKEYLSQEVAFHSEGSDIREFNNMTNMYVCWIDTPQGYAHWAILNNRTGPIR